MKTDTIRNYRNTVCLDFIARGDNFSLNVPHYRKWLSILRFLRNRGWVITENPHYIKRYACLSKYHKIGYKNNMACLLEIRAAGIEVQFGNIKNLWHGCEQAFWDNPNDERFSELTYLESCAVKLEIWKYKEYCKRFKVEVIPDKSKLSAIESIIDNLKVNTHIHGNVNCLEDIKIDMQKDNYNSQHNSTDKNKKKITCGEIKYFYDYSTKRLMCGEVWHHINNMWWVISGGINRNISAFNLFDFDPSLPKRKPISKDGIESLLSVFEKTKDYKKCLSIMSFYKL